VAKEAKEPAPIFDEKLPLACDLFTPEFIAGVVGVDAGALTIKDGSHAGNLFSRSCFFKWNDPNVTNAGIMVQVMSNPVEFDAPEYLELYVNGKKQSGETTFDSDTRILYKDFNGFGDDGAYSYELHKYIWRDGHELAYTIAFNNNLSEDEEMAAARKIATKIVEKNN